MCLVIAVLGCLSPCVDSVCALMFYCYCLCFVGGVALRVFFCCCVACECLVLLVLFVPGLFADLVLSCFYYVLCFRVLIAGGHCLFFVVCLVFAACVCMSLFVFAIATLFVLCFCVFDGILGFCSFP